MRKTINDFTKTLLTLYNYKGWLNTSRITVLRGPTPFEDMIFFIYGPILTKFTQHM